MGKIWFPLIFASIRVHSWLIRSIFGKNPKNTTNVVTRLGFVLRFALQTPPQNQEAHKNSTQTNAEKIRVSIRIRQLSRPNRSPCLRNRRMAFLARYRYE